MLLVRSGDALIQVVLLLVRKLAVTVLLGSSSVDHYAEGILPAERN